MADDWGNDESGVAGEQYTVVAVPEIKLFGKWSTDDVQVSDISLTVSILTICIGLHICWVQMQSTLCWVYVIDGFCTNFNKIEHSWKESQGIIRKC